MRTWRLPAQMSTRLDSTSVKTWFRRRFIRPIAARFRERRMKRFWDDFQVSEATRVLDVGGTGSIWRLLPRLPRLMILNVVAPKSVTHLPRVPWVIADGRWLPFRDKAFDVVFCNSVIEHLGSSGDQQLLAKECSRVGVQYYVQTPNKFFFLEPHLFTPAVHWLPKSLQRRLLRNFSIWGWLRRPSRRQCDAFLDGTRLLTLREMHQLFPDADIRRETVLGFAKSLIAERRSPWLNSAP